MVAIPELLATGTTLSFEFYPPPDDDAVGQLLRTVDELSVARPAFVSVTCGAGGQGHDRTGAVVGQIARSRPFPAMAHLTCVGHSRAEIDALLDAYEADGVTNILALAGDPPEAAPDPGGDFTYASELVEVIAARGGFSIGVAAHPEVHPRSASRAEDRRHLGEKLRMADFAITQFFFGVEPYVRMMDELAALGVDAPVVPGVFPPTIPAVVRRFATMNGTTIPAEMFERIEAADGEERTRIAVDAATELSRDLLEAGAPGVHLYTMNRSVAALAIADALGIAT